MTMYVKRKKGFTLSELAVAIILLVLVGIMVSKEAISMTNKRIDAEKVAETYELLERATQAWQSENYCVNDIKLCIRNERMSGVKHQQMFNGIAKYLPVVNSTVDLSAKGRVVAAEKLSDVDWLPYSTFSMNGDYQSFSSLGVSKYEDSYSKNMAFFMLRDGVTISINMPDVSGDTGYGFFDINGKKGANQIGVDVFPFSFGANIDKSNPLYDVAANKFNPYFSSDYTTNVDMCNINTDICSSPKLASNPTAYVLNQKKLP